MNYHVPEMSCGHCTAAITKSIMDADPKASVTTDLTTRQVSVESTLAAVEIQRAITDVGYDNTAV